MDKGTCKFLRNTHDLYTNVFEKIDEIVVNIVVYGFTSFILIGIHVGLIYLLYDVFFTSSFTDGAFLVFAIGGIVSGLGLLRIDLMIVFDVIIPYILEKKCDKYNEGNYE